MDKKEGLKKKADEHVKEMFEQVEKTKALLLLFGLEVSVAPDKTGFVIFASKDSSAEGMRKMVLREAADAFSFRLEFTMVGDVTKSPACPIATGMFLQSTMRMIMHGMKDAIIAGEEYEKALSGAGEDVEN